MELQEKQLSYLGDSKIIVHNACSDDLANIYDVLKQEEDTEDFPPLKDLLRDFESQPPWFSALVARPADSARTADSTVLGVALYHRSYWARPAPPGRALLLRSLRVRGSARRRGVGTALFRELCRIALEENAQLNWSLPPSNSVALAFFAKFKPDISDDLDGTYVLRVTPPIVAEVAECLGKHEALADITVQLARQEDMAELSKMIKEISEIRGTLDGRHLGENDLISDGFTTSPPWFFALMAFRHGLAVGTMIGHRPYNWGPSWYMQSLYVRPVVRRCGLAKQLIIEFCRMAGEQGISNVDFNVHPINTEASALYGLFRAQRLTATDHHTAFRLEIDKIKNILDGK